MMLKRINTHSNVSHRHARGKTRKLKRRYEYTGGGAWGGAARWQAHKRQEAYWRRYIYIYKKQEWNGEGPQALKAIVRDKSFL